MTMLAVIDHERDAAAIFFLMKVTSFPRLRFGVRASRVPWAQLGFFAFWYNVIQNSSQDPTALLKAPDMICGPSHCRHAMIESEKYQRNAQLTMTETVSACRLLACPAPPVAASRYEALREAR